MSQNITSTSAAVRPTERASSLATPAVTHLSHKPLGKVENLDDLNRNLEFRQRIAESLPRHMTPDRMLRTMIAAGRKSPLLRQAAMRDLIGCFLTAAQCGLEPNTPMQHLHLIPFKRTKYNPATRQREDDGIEVQVIFGYPGLLELSYRSPLVKSIDAAVVMDGDDFDFSMGTDSFLRHRPMGRSEKILFAYSVARLTDGHAFRVMPWAEVEKIRNRAQAYRMALAMREEAESKGRRLPAAWTEAPWVKHEAPMAAKTAFRALSKWLPRSIEMASVLAIDEAQERRRNIDWGAVLESTDGDYLGAAATAAEAPEEEVERVSPREDPREERRDERPSGAVRGAVFDGPPAEQGQVRTGHGAYTEQDAGAPRQEAPRDPPPAREAAPARAPAKPRQRKAEPPPAFGHTLMDAYGEPAEGNPFATAADFATAYAALWTAADDAAREAIEQHNGDALADAYADTKAAEVLAALVEIGPEPEPEPEPAQEQPAEAAQPEPPPRDRDLEWVDAMIADAEKATLDELRANYINNLSIRERVQRLKMERPELGRRIEDAFGARLARKA